MTDLKRAAVLVPLDRRPGSDAPPRLGFIQRSAKSSTHADHVGFPGGKPEPGDDSLRDTARRETVEEVALAPDDFDVVDSLDTHQTRSSDFDIRPFLGEVTRPDRFDPASREVTGTFWVPVPAFHDAYEMDGDRIRYRVPDAPGQIWGVTGRIVTSLLVTNPDGL